MSNILPTQPQPLAPIDILRAKIEELDTNLVRTHPGHKALLHTIHKMVHADEQLIYLVTPEEIGKITAGLMDLANQKILEEKVSKATKTPAAKLKNVSLDDI